MPRKDGTPLEKELEASIVLYARDILGVEVDEFSQRRRGRCRQCRASIPAGTQQTEGIPDLRFVFPSRTIWVEVKTARRKVTPKQRRFMLREIELGGCAIAVWSMMDLYWALDQLGIDTRVIYDARRPPHDQTAFWVECWRARAA